MSIGLTFRLLKYIANLAALCLTIFLTFVGFKMIVNFPECDKASGVIWDAVIHAGFFQMPILVLSTGLNIVFERRLEKRRGTNEYLVILIFHFTTLLLVTIYYAYELYGHCE